MADERCRGASSLGADEVEKRYMPVEDEIIDEVTAIRKANNDCWMRLLRLALKSNPEETRRIIADITRNDKQVTEWLNRL